MEAKTLEVLEQKTIIEAVEKLRLQTSAWVKSQQLLPLLADQKSSWEECSKRIYVSPQARVAFSSQAGFFLQAGLEQFLLDPTQRIAVILGDPGAGKTTFAKHWLAECFARYENPDPQISTPKPLPLFIELQRCLNQNQAKPENLLEAYFQGIGLNQSEIAIIKSSQPLLVFCDGYDEIAYDGNLYRDDRWADWPQAKFIITTRPEKFGLGRNVSELRELLISSFAPLESNAVGLTLYQLQDLNMEAIQSYIRQWRALIKNPWNEAMYLAQLKAIPGLSELTTNPIILSLVLFILPDLAVKYAIAVPSSSIIHKQFEQVEIYDFFVQKWFHTQSDKVWKKLAELNSPLKDRIWKLYTQGNFNMIHAMTEYMTHLGYWCLRNHVEGKLRNEIPASETLKVYLIPKACQSLTLIRPESSELLMALRSGGLLKCDSENFKFFHKSLVEYFAQAHIFRGTVGQLSSIEDCASLMTEIAEPNLIKRLAERAKSHLAFRDYLYAVLRESKKTADVSIAAANAITILNCAKQPLNQESWQGIQIPCADLSYANLHGVDFRDADLSAVNFSHAYLEEANISGSDVNGCEWGTPPSINFESKVKTVVYPWGRPWLVVGEEKGKIHLVDLICGTIEKTLMHYNVTYWDTDELVSLAVDGSQTRETEWLASAAKNGNIYVWRFIKGKAAYQYQLKHQGVRSLALSADGRRMVSGGEDKIVRVWDIKSQQVIAVLTGHSATINSVASGPDGQRVVSGSEDQSVRVWDVVSQQTVTVLTGHSGCVYSVALSLDGRRVVSGSSDQSIRVWDVVSRQAIAVLTGHSDVISSVVLSSDGRRVVSGSSDQSIRVWDVEAPRTVSVLKKYRATINSVAISPDGRRVVSGSSDKSVRVWDVEAQQALVVLKGHSNDVNSVAISMDGQRIMSGSEDKSIYVWDVVSQQAVAILTGYISTVWIVALSPDGQRVVSGGSDYTVRVWDVVSQQAVTVLNGHHGSIWCIALSTDGQRVVSGSDDKSVFVWDVESQQAVAVLNGHSDTVMSVALSLDGQRVVSGSEDKSVRVWDVVSQQAVAVLKGHSSSVRSVALSLDGQRVVSGSLDHTVRVWNVLSQQAIAVLKGHSNSVRSVALSPDGQRAVSASRDHTVRVWNVASKKCLQVIHINCVVDTIVLVADKLKVAGSMDSSLQVLTYQQTQQGLYYLTDYWYHLSDLDSSFLHIGMNIERTVGLTLKQQTLVLNQGAMGKPAKLTYLENFHLEQAEDEVSLKQLKQLKHVLTHNSKTKVQSMSLFKSDKTASYKLWSVYLYRVTKPTLRGYSSSGASRGNRHVYGLVEGLDQSNRRILIRFDLVEERAQKGIARIKVRIVEAENEEIHEGQKAFAALCQSDSNPNPKEVVCFYAGTLKLKELNLLLGQIISEMQRQLQPDETQRIRYYFRGGNDQTGEGHNCLTWLRYLFKDFKDLKIPRGTFDFFAANPADILPSNSGFFGSALPDNVTILNTSTWSNLVAVAAPSNSSS